MLLRTVGCFCCVRHDKILALAKGFRGRNKNCFRIAKNKVDKALQYAYRDRKVKKRDFRTLWIQRIGAGCREHGLNYNQFMSGLATVQVLKCCMGSVVQRAES